MRRFLTSTLSLICALAFAQSAYAEAIPNATPASQERGFVPGEVIVRFEAGATSVERLDARRAADADFKRSLKVPRAQLLEVDGAVSAAVRKLERHPDVAFAQPNYRYHTTAVAPNDTFFGDLWGLEDSLAPNPGVGALAAWDRTRGDGQVIAVVDTGVALDHPDLAGNLWTGAGGVHGHDFVDGDTDPDDYNFHGTHVAGTAAAIDDNGLGIAGVAPNAQIMAVRVLDGDGSGASDDIGNGIAYAAQNGADVINLSLGGDSNSDPFMAAGIAVADQLNAVVVAAAGNENNNNDSNPTMPCNIVSPNLICVAAVDEDGLRAGFSNYGATSVDVGGPGTNILSAETDYGAVLTEDFATSDGWVTATGNGGAPWGLVASPNTDGNSSATDSPGGSYGNATDPLFYAQSILRTSAPISLVGERGCRMHFNLRYALEEGFDYFTAHGRPPDVQNDLFWTGSTGGSFFGEELSISELDGSASVTPQFTVLSDETVTDDGAYVDELDLLCREDASPTGDYVEFNGTSMATPHVAGVAALVKAADPGIPDSQVVQAIMSGGTPLASLSGKTVSGRTANAPGAIAAALGLSNTPPPVKSMPSTTPPPAPPSSPAKADLSGAKSKIRVSRKGTFKYTFRAGPGLAGNARFRTRRKVVVSRKGHVTVADKRFSVPGSGVATVRVKLSKKKLRILRRNGKFALKVRVTVRNAAGLSSVATKRLTLMRPRR